MPWPISTCGMISVTSPCRSIRMKAFGAKVAASAARRRAPRDGKTEQEGRGARHLEEAPAREVGGVSATGRVRRGRMLRCRAWRSGPRRCALDRLPDAHIGPAATDVAGHGRVDVRVVGMRDRIEQGRRRHDLARLAIAALDDFEIQPSLLYFRAVGRSADALDGRDRTRRRSCPPAKDRSEPACRPNAPYRRRTGRYRSRTSCPSGPERRAAPRAAACRRGRRPLALSR